MRRAPAVVEGEGAFEKAMLINYNWRDLIVRATRSNPTALYEETKSQIVRQDDKILQGETAADKRQKKRWRADRHPGFEAYQGMPQAEWRPRRGGGRAGEPLRPPRSGGTQLRSPHLLPPGHGIFNRVIHVSTGTGAMKPIGRLNQLRRRPTSNILYGGNGVADPDKRDASGTSTRKLITLL